MHNHFSVAKRLWMRWASGTEVDKHDERRTTLTDAGDHGQYEKKNFFPPNHETTSKITMRANYEEEDTRWMDERIKSDLAELWILENTLLLHNKAGRTNLRNAIEWMDAEIYYLEEFQLKVSASALQNMYF